MSGATELVLSVSTLLLFSSAVGAQSTSVPQRKSGQLIVSHDQQGLFTPAFVIAETQKLNGRTLVKLIEETVDVHADAKVDILVQCVFARYSTGMPDCKSAQTWRPTPDIFPKPQYNHLWNGMAKLGNRDRLRIVMDRCRKRDIRFVAGMRMNDRHRITRYVQKMYDEHPEWRLEGPVGALSDRVGALDFKHDGVRQSMLTFIAEFLDKYDADGMEFDYMRMCHMFRPQEARENAYLLTDFMRKARLLLDAASRNRQRGRLLLGVRVPQTMVECTNLGFDVETWIKDGLIDYVCPSDFWATDFVARTEEFSQLTKGTNCKVYPSVSPTAVFPGDVWYLKPAHYRAAAKNFYAFGADGVAAYNYFWTWSYQHKGVTAKLGNVWPTGSLLHLTQLKHAKSIDANERRYLCYPLWRGRCPTGAIKHDRLVVNRKKPKQKAFLRFRMAEDLSKKDVSAILEFKATGMHEDDNVALSLNGKPIDPVDIQRTFDSDGQSLNEGLRLPAYYLYRIKLQGGVALFGDNQLGARLTSSVGTNDVVIQELEVVVTPVKAPKPGDKHARTESPVVFVRKGKARLVRQVGKAWTRDGGKLVCSGEQNFLFAGKKFGPGDFHVRARLSLDQLNDSAASFTIASNNFGFDGDRPGKHRFFVQGGNKRNKRGRVSFQARTALIRPDPVSHFRAYASKGHPHGTFGKSQKHPQRPLRDVRRRPLHLERPGKTVWR